MFIPVALILLSLSAAHAQVSSGCTSALGSIATNPDSEACLSPSSLVSIFIGSSDSSVIDPINNWLNGICTVGSCSNATLAAIVTNITSGCPSELGTLGYDASQPQALIDIVQDAYPTVRQVLCLKREDEFCVTETLTAIQSDLNTTLSISNLVTLVGSGLSTASAIPTSTRCSDCSKAAYSILKNDYPSLINGTESDIEAECGATFTDGSMPSNVLQTAPDGQASSSSQDSDSAFGVHVPAPLPYLLGGLAVWVASVLTSAL